MVLLPETENMPSVRRGGIRVARGIVFTVLGSANVLVVVDGAWEKVQGSRSACTNKRAVRRQSRLQATQTRCRRRFPEVLNQEIPLLEYLGPHVIFLPSFGWVCLEIWKPCV